jgi:hypothetical protein
MSYFPIRSLHLLLRIDELEEFVNAVQTVDSVMVLVKTTRRLLSHIKDLRFILEENFKRVHPAPYLNQPHQKSQAKRKTWATPNLEEFVQRNQANALAEAKASKKRAAVERFYLNVALNNLSQMVEQLLQALDDFPEFTNERGRDDLLSFILTLQVCFLQSCIVSLICTLAELVDNDPTPR